MHRRTVIDSVAAVGARAGAGEGEAEAAGAPDDSAESKDAKEAAGVDVDGAKGSDVSKAEALNAVEDALEVEAAAAAAASSKVGVADLDLAADSKAFLRASKGLGAAAAAMGVGDGCPQALLANGSRLGSGTGCTESGGADAAVAAGDSSSSLLALSTYDSGNQPVSPLILPPIHPGSAP